MLLQPGQAALWSSHQIAHRRIALAHLGQHRLARNAAIHHPDAPGLAVLRLDLAEKLPQRLVIRRVAGEHLVGQRQALRRDHQGDHHLRTIRPMITAVTMPALVAFRQLCGVDLKIGAGQIIEQHIEAGVEQVAPASDQVREQRVLVPQAVGHGRRTVYAPRPGQNRRPRDRPWHCCRTSRDAASTHCPARSADRRPEPGEPGPIASLFGSGAGGRPRTGPAATPATADPPANTRPIAAAGTAAWLTGKDARPTCRAHAAQRSSGNSASVRGCPDAVIEYLDGLAPSRGLRGMDLPQVQNVSLHHPAVIAHSGLSGSCSGMFAASTKRRTSSTEARLAFAVLTRERNAA